MALDQETIDAQLQQLASHRQRLALLLQQQAKFGAYTPPYVLIDIQEAQSAIRGIKEHLSADGVLIEDEPNDDVQPVDFTLSTRSSFLEQRNRSRMLDRVEAFWIKGVLEQSLYQVARIELGLEFDPDAVVHPWESVIQQPNQPNQTIPPGKPVVEVFDKMGGELLILGAPGAGKTTLLLELARDLIARARQNESHLIPVVFNLSTWATRRQSLDKWLVEELNQRYDVPRKLAQDWVAVNAILPLLDGLDEVAAEHREACVDAINEYRTAAEGFVPLAVCSRVTDYEALRTKLRLQGAIVIQPLTKSQVNDYLKQVGRPLAAVRAALRDDATLWELIENPLMLSIVALAYKDKSPAKLRATVTPQERRRQLFDDYIAAMFRRRGSETRYSQHQTLRWLGWLACGMIQQAKTEFLVERLQPEWLSTRAMRLQYVLLDRLGGGLVVGLVFGLVFGLVGTLLGGLVLGLVFGLGALFFGGQIGIETLQQRPIGRTIVDALVGGLVVGLVGGLLGGLVFALVFALDDGLDGGLYGGLLGALVGGLLGVLTGKPGVSPRQVIVVEQLRWVWSKAWRSAASALVVGLVVGLGSGLVVGLVVGLSVGLGAELGSGLVVGLSVGLVGGLVGALGGGLSGTELEIKATPNQGIRRSARSWLVFGLGVGLGGGLVGGLVGGLFIGLVVAPGAGLSVGLVFGLVFGLVGGLVYGLNYGGRAVLQHYTLRWFLSGNGSLPFRLGPFLNYCAERIFLRRVGGGYIFVHRLLMEHFAGLARGTEE